MTAVLNGHEMGGTTTNRPTNVEIGQPYYNVTTGTWQVWNGSAWETGSAGGVVQSQGSNGLFETKLNLMAARNSDGSTIAASAAAGKFGLAITLGTSFALASESANNNTKTDVALWEYVLPPTYKSDQDITVTVNASITGAGTLSTKTAQIKAYKTASDGTQGADIGPGSASAMTAAGADVAFTVTGTGLVAGDKLVFSLTTILTESASSGMVANINSVRVS